MVGGSAEVGPVPRLEADGDTVHHLSDTTSVVSRKWMANSPADVSPGVQLAETASVIPVTMTPMTRAAHQRTYRFRFGRRRFSPVVKHYSSPPKKPMPHAVSDRGRRW